MCTPHTPHTYGCHANGCLDSPVIVTSVKSDSDVPRHLQGRGLTPRILFKTAVDLRAMPKKALLRTFAEYAEDGAHKLEMLWLSSQQGTTVHALFGPPLAVMRSVRQAATTLHLSAVHRTSPSLASCAAFRVAGLRLALVDRLLTAARPPLNVFIEHVGALQPRYYSAASASEGSVQFAFNVIDDVHEDGSNMYGSKYSALFGF